MKNVFKEKVINEFSKEKNYNKIMLETERMMSMKKIRYFLAPVCACAIVAVGVIGFNMDKNIKENNNKEIVCLADNIRINEIQNMASTKLMVDSKVIDKGDLPSELAQITNIDGNEVSSIFAYYTKSDYTKEEFDLLHDYVLVFDDEETHKNIKISASEVDSPLRDYFFQSTSDDISDINGVKVKISKYKNKYIVNFTKDEYHYDIETNSMTEAEMINLVKEVLK